MGSVERISGDPKQRPLYAHLQRHEQGRRTRRARSRQEYTHAPSTSTHAEFTESSTRIPARVNSERDRISDYKRKRAAQGGGKHKQPTRQYSLDAYCLHSEHTREHVSASANGLHPVAAIFIQQYQRSALPGDTLTLWPVTLSDARSACYPATRVCELGISQAVW